LTGGGSGFSTGFKTEKKKTLGARGRKKLDGPGPIPVACGWDFGRGPRGGGGGQTIGTDGKRAKVFLFAEIDLEV